jgi:hypothetical protein
LSQQDAFLIPEGFPCGEVWIEDLDLGASRVGGQIDLDGMVISPGGGVDRKPRNSRTVETQDGFTKAVKRHGGQSSHRSRENAAQIVGNPNLPRAEDVGFRAGA